MPVTQVGTPAAPATQTGTLTLSVTGSWSGTQPRNAGDFLVAVVCTWGQTLAGAISGTAGWTAGPTALASTGPQSQAEIFTKIATGSDTAPTFTATNTGSAASSRMSVELLELTGNNTVTPIGASGTATSVAGLALNIATSGNVPVAGCYAVAGWMIGNSVAAAVTFTPGAGFTNVTNDGSTATFRAHAGTDIDGSPAAGSALTDALTWTVTNSGAAAGAIIVVQPPAAVTAAATPVPAVSRPLPRSRARLGARGLCAAGILAAGITAQPGTAPPPQPRPVITHPAPHRAAWRSVTGQAYAAVAAPRQRPPQPRTPAPHAALWRRQATAAQQPQGPSRLPLPLRRPGPHRAITGGVRGLQPAAVTGAAVPPPSWRPQPRAAAPHRIAWRLVTGQPPAAGAAVRAPKLIPQPRHLPAARGTWRRVTGTGNAPPPLFTVGALTASDTAGAALTAAAAAGALTAATAPQGALTAGTQAAGGPS